MSARCRISLTEISWSDWKTLSPGLPQKTPTSTRRGLGTVSSHTTQTSGSMKRNFLPPANSTLQRRCTTPTERKPMFDYRSMFDLSGKPALVLGAGSGIGEASAQGLGDAAAGPDDECGL